MTHTPGGQSLRRGGLPHGVGPTTPTGVVSTLNPHQTARAMDQEAAELSVLLVEDNPGDARLIREMAAEASQATARLAHVDRLAAALDRLSQPGIDVALLDLGLPDSQGLATFTQLRD